MKTKSLVIQVILVAGIVLVSIACSTKAKLNPVIGEDLSWMLDDPVVYNRSGVSDVYSIPLATPTPQGG